MTAALEKLIEQVRALSPAERDELRAWIDAAPAGATAEDAFGQRLLDSGIGRPRSAGALSANPEPIRVEGRPLSEQLIEERR